MSSQASPPREFRPLPGSPVPPGSQLKRSPRRTVERIPDENPQRSGLVVKRYHHPGRVARLLDRRRADQEFRLLSRLDAAGVAVPRPIEVRRSAEGWELVTEWIQDAVPLEAILRGTASPPADPERLAGEAGRALACAHAAGLVHGDLHPGNLVVQPGGRTWIVDLRGARITRSFDVRVALRDLVSLASGVRERSGAGVRARFLSAYLRALPSGHAVRFPDRAHLEARLESAARIHRREAVRRSRLRWTRRSSVCRPVESAGIRGFASLEVDDARLSRWDGEPANLPVPHGVRAEIVRDGRWHELLRLWYAAARLTEHGIRSARPLVLARGPARFASFALPSSARPMPEPAARAHVTLLEVDLNDRGLALDGPLTGRILVDSLGRAWLGPLLGVRLLDLDVEASRRGTRTGEPRDR